MSEKLKKQINLFDYNLKEMIKSAGIKIEMGKKIGLVLFFIPSIIFTFRIIQYDRKIEKSGIQKACEWLLKKYYTGVESNKNNIPEKGGVILVSNHPGIGDSTALLSIIKRNDLKIIVLDKIFFQSLPAMFKYIIPVPESKREMSNAIFLILQHLKNGGMILLYPAGCIEPDPEFCKTKNFLKDWSPLIGYLCLKAKKRNFNFKISPVVVSNVFSAKSLNHPILKYRNTRDDKEKLAALHILITHSTKKQKIKLNFKNILDSLDLALKYNDSIKITEFVKNEMRTID